MWEREERTINHDIAISLPHSPHPTIMMITSYGCLATVAANKATDTPKATNVYAKPARTVILIGSFSQSHPLYILSDKLEELCRPYGATSHTPTDARTVLLFAFAENSLAVAKKTQTRPLLQSRQQLPKDNTRREPWTPAKQQNLTGEREPNTVLNINKCRAAVCEGNVKSGWLYCVALYSNVTIRVSGPLQ